MMVSRTASIRARETPKLARTTIRRDRISTATAMAVTADTATTDDTETATDMSRLIAKVSFEATTRVIVNTAGIINTRAPTGTNGAGPFPWKWLKQVPLFC